MKFKVGDRVVVDGNVDGLFFTNHKGKVITITEGGTLTHLIEFDENIGGHDGLGRGEDEHCWWCKPESIKLDVEEAKVSKPQFKVGDRVKVKSDLLETFLVNKCGTVIYDDGQPSVNYLVEFDEAHNQLHDGWGKGEPNRCYWLDARYLEKIETPKPDGFKVGDRVTPKVGEHTGKLATYKGINGTSSLLEFDENIDGHGGCYPCYGKDGHCWWYVTDDIELVEEKITIYRKGRKVIAENTLTGKKAEAKCHEDDTFDFTIGAKLAFERLVEEPEPKLLKKFEKGKTYVFDKSIYIKDMGDRGYSWVDYADGKEVIVDGKTTGTIFGEKGNTLTIHAEWCKEVEKPKTFTGKIFCIKGNDDQFVKGKIYEVNDDIVYSDIGIIPYTYDATRKRVNGCSFHNEFIEVIE